MFKQFIIFVLMLSLNVLAGCASVHKGAEKVGEATGKAISVPNSLSEGAAKGIAGEPESNPYNR